MKQYPKIEEAKKAIIDIGRRMYQKGFVAANDGNISVRIGKNEILTTPTGVSKGFMKKKMLVITDLDGNMLKGTYKPSSELKTHLRAYKEDSQLRSVCHAHPPYCVACSVLGENIDAPIIAEAVLSLGSIPVLPYAELGSFQIPNLIAPYIHSHNGVILGNHGAVSWGDNPYAAFYRLESMEFYAQIHLLTKPFADERKMLTSEQINALIAMRKRFGIRLQ